MTVSLAVLLGRLRRRSAGAASRHGGLRPALARRGDVAVIALIVAIIALMVLPIPLLLLDLLIAVNIAASICLLMMAVYVPQAVSLTTTSGCSITSCAAPRCVSSTCAAIRSNAGPRCWTCCRKRTCSRR